ncbi:hypothetical protein ERJ75_000567000 [Trypanosoma vivax]|nr:hypothetical protein ERJ75_001306300 [Trypanosoma vivax]KAH8615628.1 hypothetical protein ERJ75_000567000 [Trypanosoma vivax]
MEASAEKTEHTLFGARDTNLLSLKVGEAALKEVRAPKPLGPTVQPHKGLSKHVLSMKAAAGTRLMQLREVASPEWGPEREKLRAFCVALVRAKMCYGVASLWFDTSLSDRERLERVRAQAAHIAAGIPKTANGEDALREARLKPINEAVRRRALEHYLRLKAKGPTHAKVADSIFPPEHPIHVRLAKAQRLCSTIGGTEKRHDATRCSWPCVSASMPPRRVASRQTRQTRTRRCTPLGACGGSVSLTVRCGQTGPWCQMSRQAPERWCSRRRVDVRRWCFELCRLRAAIARSVWRWRRN